MNTRQELGIALLAFLLALPLAFAPFAGGGPRAAHSLSACTEPLLTARELFCLEQPSERQRLQATFPALAEQAVPRRRWRSDGLVPLSGPERLLLGLRIDVNQAREADLELLPGIGPALAARIAQAREQRGTFRSVDELLEVRGIGPKTLERLAPFACVGCD